MMKIGILGGGSWGTALAILLSKKGLKVDMWARDLEQVNDIKKYQENKKYLPNIRLPENLFVSNNMEKTIIGKDIIMLAIPSHGIRETLDRYTNLIKKNQIIVNLSKGIENKTLLRISEVVEEFLPENKFVVLSGPSHAEEVAINLPTTVVVASKDKKSAELVQDTFMTPKFRVYTNSDLVGVELGGSLKNIIALAAGISDGLGYGDNTKSALMTRGIVEITRLGRVMGASRETFSGLSGIGDLIVTCTSKYSRNRKAGLLLGRGLSLDEAIKEIGMVAEGVKTTNSAYYLSRKYKVSMPITEELYNILYKEKDVKESVFNLMEREKKQEIEDDKFNID